MNVHVTIARVSSWSCWTHDGDGDYDPCAILHPDDSGANVSIQIRSAAEAQALIDAAAEARDFFVYAPEPAIAGATG